MDLPPLPEFQPPAEIDFDTATTAEKVAYFEAFTDAAQGHVADRRAFNQMLQYGQTNS